MAQAPYPLINVGYHKIGSPWLQNAVSSRTDFGFYIYKHPSVFGAKFIPDKKRDETSLRL